MASRSKPLESSRPSLFGRLLDLLNGAGSLLICAIMVMVCADVVARTAFNSPIPGVADIVAAVIVVIVFLQIGSALRAGRFIQSEMFLIAIKNAFPKCGHGLQALFDLAGAFVFAVIGYALWPVLVRAIEDQEFLGVVGIFTAPTWPIYAVLLLGSAMTALQYCCNAYQSMRFLWLRGEG